MSKTSEIRAYFEANPKPKLPHNVRNPYYDEVSRMFNTSRSYIKKLYNQFTQNPENIISQTLESNGLDPHNWSHGWVKDKGASVFLKNKQDLVTYDDIRDELIESAKDYAPKYAKFEREVQGEHLLIIDPSDLHIGKLALSNEAGELYNVEKAVERAREGVKGLISKAAGFTFDKIIFVVGNDVLHVDTPKRTTTSGTPQDTDSMWWDCYIKARELYVELIELLLTVADVHVVYCPSNHDYMSGFMLADSLLCWFNNCDQVTFDCTMKHRKFYEYGLNMMMFDHGDGHKVQETPYIMASNAPQMWGRTKLRYSYKHHLHHKQRINWLTEKDYHGCTVEFMRSPSSADRWHDTNGYNFVPKAIEGFIHHKDQGQVCRVTHYF